MSDGGEVRDVFQLQKRGWSWKGWSLGVDVQCLRHGFEIHLRGCREIVFSLDSLPAAWFTPQHTFVNLAV